MIFCKILTGQNAPEGKLIFSSTTLLRFLFSGENWDVEAAIHLFTVLRGASPFYHSGPMRSAPTPQNFNTSLKPPVAPKPVFDHKPSSGSQHITEGRSSGGSKLAPLPPPRSRKVGALPKLHHDGQSVSSITSQGLPPVSPDILPVASILVDTYIQKSINVGRVGSLPPILKCSGGGNLSPNSCATQDFCSPSSTTPVATSVVPSVNKYSSKSHSGSAKNALLIEKVRGTSSSYLEYQKSSVNDGITRASSVPHYNPPNPSHVTINSSCIVSVNNPNNNTNKNNNIYLNDYSPMLNTSGTLLSSTASQTTNSVYSSAPYSSHPHLLPSSSSVAIQVTSRDSSPPFSPTPVPSSTGPTSVIIPSNTIVTNTHVRDPKLTRIMNVGSSNEYRYVPGTNVERTNNVSERQEVNCICDCRESLEKSVSRESPLADGDLKKSDKVEKKYVGDDEVDRVLRPNMTHLSTLGSGPSLSAPCSPAKPLLRKTEAVDLEEYDYCEYQCILSLMPHST